MISIRLDLDVGSARFDVMMCFIRITPRQPPRLDLYKYFIQEFLVKYSSFYVLSARPKQEIIKIFVMCMSWVCIPIGCKVEEGYKGKDILARRRVAPSPAVLCRMVITPPLKYLAIIHNTK